MTAGPVNRALLESNFQNPGDVYSDLKTEGAFDVVADQIDDNWDYTTSLVANGTLTPYPSFLSRQAIINGNFDVWQRGTSFTNPANATYTADRWRVNFNADGGTFPTTITVGRTTLSPAEVDKTTYGFDFTTNGAGTSFGANAAYGCEQKVENGVRLLCGSGKKVTISFYARSNIAGKKIGIFMIQNYGTGGSPSAQEKLLGQTFTLTSSYTKYTVTFTTNTLSGKTFGTSNDDVLRVIFQVMWGTTEGTANYSNFTGAETFGGSGFTDIAQVQVNAGDTALLFQPKSYEDEIIACGNPDDTNTFGYNQTARPSVLTYPVNSLARQAIINGNFDVWQRGTSFTNPLDQAFTADHYQTRFVADGGVLPTITHSRLTFNGGDLLNTFYGYRYNVNGAGSGFGTNALAFVAQKIEQGTRFLAGTGKKISVSFFARSDIPNKKIGVSWQQNYGTGGSPTAQENNVGTTFALTSTLTKYTFTFTTNTLFAKTFGTNNDDFINIQFFYMWGTTIGSTRLNTGVAESFVGAGNIDIAQVQVNAGDVSLPFQPRSFADELAACQRYYEKSYNNATPIATVTNTGSFWFDANGTSDPIIAFPFKTEKRITPTMIFYNPATGSTGTARNTTLNTDVTINAGSSLGSNTLSAFIVGTPTAGNDIRLHWVADAEL